jgi:hypothetical protein
MLKTIVKLISLMISRIFRRGRGIFKILFVIDDFIRLFTMTLIIPYIFSLITSNQILIVLGVVLGLVIDVHDFISEFGEGKITR